MREYLQDCLKDWQYLWRQMGLWPAARRALQWFVGNVTSNLLLLQLDIDLDRPIAIRDPKIPVAVRRAQPADVDRLRGKIKPSDLKYFARALDLDDVGLVALYGDEIAAYAWLTLTPRPALERRGIPMTAQDFYLHNDNTLPQFRRQGLQSTLLDRRLRLAQQHGRRRGYLQVLSTNAASMHIGQVIGAQVVAILPFWKMLA